MEDVSLRLDPGEVLCVVGESGSGKSVSAAALTGLLPPGLSVAAGRIMVQGRDVRSLDAAGLRR